MAKKKKDPKISGFKVHELAFEKNDTYYIPYQLKDIDPGLLRKEYTRLRDISQKRLKRLAASEFSDSEAYKYNVDRFKKIKDIKSDAELRILLSDLSRFVNAESSTIKGQWAILARRVESMQKNIPGLIIPSDPKEQLQWFKFMDWMVEKKGVDIKYHVSAGAQRALAYDEKVKELVSKGEYDEARIKMYELQGEYTRPEDQVTQAEQEAYFKID